LPKFRQQPSIGQGICNHRNAAKRMKPQNLSELSMEELLAEQKKRKTALLTQQFIIGLIAGIAVYSVVKNGFRFFPLALPLLFIFIFVRSGKGLKTSLQNVQAEIKSRNE
jgi:hypothetical protein